jgi:glycosyltransferase involved in cell wall biosynthesis
VKILLIHNDYGKYSGEEAVVDKLYSLFIKGGHDVRFFRKSSAILAGNILGNIKGLVSGIYNPYAARELKQVLEEFKPDVVNVHNVYPLISPASLFECKKLRIPVVMTVHNYRLICPTGLFLRNGSACEKCIGGREYHCIQYNCEGSVPKSIGYAVRNLVARKTGAYSDTISRFACLTGFQKRKLVEAGFDAKKITIIPNSFDAPDSIIPSEESYVAYAGRLSYEKGFDLLLDVARANPDIRFRFAGSLRDGEKQPDLPANAELTGYLDKTQLTEFYKNARFIVMPSRCYEGFPMAILEAASFGKPVIGPAHAGFIEIIQDGETGLCFRPGDTHDLADKVKYLWGQPLLSHNMGQKALNRLKKNYSTEVVYKMWMDVFEEVIGIPG